MTEIDLSFSKASRSTQRLYFLRFMSIVRECAEAHPDMTQLETKPIFMAHYILKRWTEWKPRTRRVNRAAATFFWTATKFPGWEEAINLLAARSSGEPTCSACNKTTSRRLKYVPRIARKELLRYAYMREKNGHRNAQHLINFMIATAIIGCRPGEWDQALLYSDIKNKKTLINIINSKHDETRGNGPSRTLIIRKLRNKEINSIYQIYGFFSSHPRALQILEEELHNTRDTINKNFNGTKKERDELSRIDLYSFRHKFVCDCKFQKLDPVVIAALCGHSKEETHKNHYGRPNKGYSAVRVEPTPETLAAVRDYLKSQPEQITKPPANDDSPSP